MHYNKFVLALSKYDVAPSALAVIAVIVEHKDETERFAYYMYCEHNILYLYNIYSM